MNSLLLYESYFQQIAQSYTPIKSFYHIDLFDFNSFENDLRGMKYAAPVLILESYTADTIARHADNIHSELSGAIIILGQFDPKKLTKQSKTEFLSTLETHIKQIRAKMLDDHRHPCNPMYGLVPESVSWSKTETIAGTFQGFRMQFTIAVEDNVALNNNWV